MGKHCCQNTPADCEHNTNYYLKTIEDFYADEAIRKAANLPVLGKKSQTQSASHNVSRDDNN